jgi:hypothetical protein
MNTPTLLGLFLATIVAVSCGPHHHQSHHRRHHAKQVAEPKSIAHSHTFKIQHHQVPEEHRAEFAKFRKANEMTPRFEQPSELPSRLLPKESKFPGAKATNTGSSGNVPVENYYDYMMIANISVGTPAQTVRVNINPSYGYLKIVADCASNVPSHLVEKAKKPSSDYSSDYTFGSGSGSSSSEAGAQCDNYGKLTYNARKSSTAAMLKAIDRPAGTMVNDVVKLSDLGLNLTLVDSNAVNFGMTFDYLPIDGFFGISSTLPNDTLNVLNQLVGQLDKPVFVLNLYRNFNKYMHKKMDPTDVNEITIGTDQANGCSSDWQYHALGDLGSRYDGFVNVTSIFSTAADGRSNWMSATRVVNFANYFAPLYVSYEVEELIVNATGAQWDDDLEWWTTPCDQVASGQNVSMNVAGGGVITLTPKDLHVKYTGVCYMYVYGFYKENDAKAANYAITLAQQFGNNHCVASNFGDNTVGISNKV